MFKCGRNHQRFHRWPSVRAALVGGRNSNVRDDWAKNCWRDWFTSVKGQVTEYSEITKLSITQMSSEEKVNGLSIRWHKAVVRSGLVHHFACADFFPVPEKKDVLSDPVRAWNAGRAYALAGGKRTTYQAGYVWGQSLIAEQVLLSPDSWGWAMSEPGWVPFWTPLFQASEALEELASCSCTKSYVARCLWFKRDLVCTARCKCGGSCVWSVRSYSEASYQIKPDTCWYVDMVHYIIMHDVQFRISNMNNVAFCLD